MKNKHKLLIACLMAFSLSAVPLQVSRAAVPLAVMEVIRAGVKKVIRAIDLRTQRLQNQTLWLQNAQKTLENALSKLKLEEISGWTERQRDLYQEYFQELMNVKALISSFQRVRDLSEKHRKLLAQYQSVWKLISQDDHFSAEERAYMASVYSGILAESLKNIDLVFMVVNSFSTQMNDASRLEILRTVADQLDANYEDLSRFNQQNTLLSLQRAKEQNDINRVKQLYGLP